jgi:hypothetical protein
MKRPLVYIASPYSIGDAAVNVRTQFLVAEQLWAAGFLPYPPLYDHFWHFLNPHEGQYWMALDGSGCCALTRCCACPGRRAGPTRKSWSRTSTGSRCFTRWRSYGDGTSRTARGRIRAGRRDGAGWREIMKAKEYAARYQETKSTSGPDAAIMEMWRAFLGEFKTIKEQRHARTADAQLAIVNELDKKWRAICRHVGGDELNEDGYEKIVADKMPGVYGAWKKIPLPQPDAGRVLRTYAMLGAIWQGIFGQQE